MCDLPFWQTRGQNRENAAHLTRRLYRLEAAISAVPPATPSAQYQRDELARYVSPSEICSNTLNLGCTFRKLDAITERLKRLCINNILGSADNILGSADIGQAILNCIREIDEQELDYLVSFLYGYSLCPISQFNFQVLSQMQIEYSLQGVAAFLDNQGRMPSSVQQEIVFVKDATRREYKLFVEQCQSREVSCVHRT